MAVLAKFFNVWAILTVVILITNMSTLVFGNALTGTTIEDMVGNDEITTAEASDLTLRANQIEQVESIWEFPGIAFGSAVDFLNRMVGIKQPYQTVLRSIFAKIDDQQICSDWTQCSDIPEQAGNIILIIVVIFQVAGLFYAGFAIFSAARGGSSGP